MDAYVTQPRLRAALTILGAAVQAKPVIESLGTIKITAILDDGEQENPATDPETFNGIVRLQATDLSRAVTCDLPACVRQTGEVCIPYRLEDDNNLTEYVATLPSERVRMELRSEGANAAPMLLMTTSGTLARVVTASADEFPVIPLVSEDDAPVARFDPGELARAIDTVAYATGDAGGNPVLACVLMKLHADGTATLAACDGVQFAERFIQSESEGELEILMHPSILAQVKSIIRKLKEPVDLYVDPEAGHYIFRSKYADIMARAADGTFPNYRRIIPDKFDTAVTCSRSALYDAIQACKIFSAYVDLRLEGTGDTRTLRVESYAVGNGMGRSARSLQVHASGVAFSIRFQRDRLAQMIAHIESDDVILRYTLHEDFMQAGERKTRWKPLMAFDAADSMRAGTMPVTQNPDEEKRAVAIVKDDVKAKPSAASQKRGGIGSNREDWRQQQADRELADKLS